MHRSKRLASLVALASLLLLITALQYEPVDGTPVTSGPADDNAAVLTAIDGRLLLIFERESEQENHADLYVTTSDDDGATWSEPTPVRAADSDERLGSVVRLADGTLRLFYSYAPSPGGVYKIHRASSEDGVTWAFPGAVDLNQPLFSPTNPDVVVEPDGRLTMVYELVGPSGIFVAQSADGGDTWDSNRTQIDTPIGATAPRIAHTPDGGYILTYNIFSGHARNVYARYATDPYVWEGTARPIAVGSSVGIDSFDGLPLLLNDGTMAVFYSQSWNDAPADLYYRVSDRGFLWEPPRQVTANTVDELMPFALPSSTQRGVHLTWIQTNSPPAFDHDIYFHGDLEIAPLPTATPTPGPPTATPTAAVNLSPTVSPSPVLTPTETLLPTYTPQPTQTPSPTPPTPSATPTSSPTPTLTLTPTQTATTAPLLRLIAGEYPSSVAPGDVITVTWRVQTSHGANTWIEWGTQPDDYVQRHDFPWMAGGVYELEYGITAPTVSGLYFRVTADDDIHEPVSWSGHVLIASSTATPTTSTPESTPTVGPVPSVDPAAYLPYMGR